LPIDCHGFRFSSSTEVGCQLVRLFCRVSPRIYVLDQLHARDNSLTIFLQNIDEVITFELERNGTVACDAVFSNLWGMKTATKPKGQATGQTKLTLSGNGKGARPKRTRDRAAKKQALIQAALGLFASKGYEVTTTREIAASAGCAEGLIHRYFKGKPGLLAAMIEYRVSKEALELSHPSRPARNLEDEFLQLVDREVERVWESRDFLRVVIPRAIVDPSVGSVMNKTLISARAKEISERLKRYESCVNIPQGAMEALTQAVGMLGLVFGFVRPVLLGHDRLRAKQMAATVAKILVGSPAVSLVA
jgi:TetR/AcrR family transcriptional regulator, regulator of cefoperazone and chloramphenicol sensitivity